MRYILFILLFTAILLGSCAPGQMTPATGTPLPFDTPDPTQTIVWFPPSATATPQAIPTYTVTAEMNPGIGEILLADDFSDDSVWDVAASDQGSAAIGRNRLTLVVQPGVYIASLRRETVFDNFYAEITAHTSLCRGDDTYGLLVRAVASSFYRFVLSCNGTLHVERIFSGTRLIILEPTSSGDAPTGAPGEVRIGLWAVGSEMRLFLNDRFQFSIVDKSFQSGALGVFARAAGETPVTVTFSDLTVYDVSNTSPTRTPSP
jgi:hypothetical protein